MEIQSDLLIEQMLEAGNFKTNGESSFENGLYGYTREDYEISTPEQAKKFKKPQGKYSLLTFKNTLQNEKKYDNYYTKKLANALTDYLPKITNKTTILVVGLGNRHISADSLGVEVVKGVNVTRGLISNTPQICAIAPSVMGLTGIETADTIGGIVNKIKPDVIIMIDSLCASDSKRIATSFQISNTPIVPGSGINNTRKKLKTPTPTISIGVPFVVYSSTFVKTALKQANIRQKVNVEDNLLVTLKDIEFAIKTSAKIIADAINIAVFN